MQWKHVEIVVELLIIALEDILCSALCFDDVMASFNCQHDTI